MIIKGTPYKGVATAASIWFSPGGSNVTYGLIKTFDSDGFTITWGKNGDPLGAGTVAYLALR